MSEPRLHSATATAEVPSQFGNLGHKSRLMAAVSTIRRHVGVVLAVDGDLLAALKQLFDDDRLIRDHTGTAVGVEETGAPSSALRTVGAVGRSGAYSARRSNGTGSIGLCV